MAVYRDEAVVLRTAKLGEADRIITMLTKEHGKVRAVAKGVRRTKSRFGARLEPFMRVDLLLNEGRTFDSIRQAESLAAYAAGITGDYRSYTAANAMCETASDLFAAEHEPAPAQYRLLIAALGALSRHAHDAQAISLSYILRAMALAGWTIRLDSCVVCGRQQISYFSAPAGGAMCADDRTPDATRVDERVFAQLRALEQGDWQSVDELLPIDARTENIVREWAQYYLERPIRSLGLLD